MKRYQMGMIWMQTLVLGLLGLVGTSLAYSEVPTPILSYQFDEGTGTTVSDSGSGTPLNATLNGTATWSSNTPSGTGSSVLITNDGTRNNGVFTSTVSGTKVTGLSQYTIALWVQYPSTPAALTKLVSTLNAGTFQGFDFYINNSTATTLTLGLSVNFNAGTYSCVAPSAASYNANQWLFLAVSYDGTQTATNSNNVTFYSGTQAGLTTLGTASIQSGALGAVGGPLEIDNTAASGSVRTATALFDSVSIYSGALTASDIDSIRMLSVPEPSSMALVSLALACLVLPKFRAQTLLSPKRRRRTL